VSRGMTIEAEGGKARSRAVDDQTQAAGYAGQCMGEMAHKQVAAAR
jgi:hypothetical protein